MHLLGMSQQTRHPGISARAAITFLSQSAAIISSVAFVFGKTMDRTLTSWTSRQAQITVSPYARAERTSWSLELASARCYDTLFRQDSGLSMSTDQEPWPNQSAAANRRPAGQLDGSGNLSATVAPDRAFPAAVAELGR
jgi:hypothetical protein